MGTLLRCVHASIPGSENEYRHQLSCMNPVIAVHSIDCSHDTLSDSEAISCE
jgi:hypothetical protein